MVLFASAAFSHFPLHHIEYFRVNDGFVIILDIVLRNLAFIDLCLFGQEVDGVGLL